MTTGGGGLTTSGTGFLPRASEGQRACLHAGPGVGRRLRGASHATPRAAEEARVVTTGDEISLNYHSVGLGSAACHAATAWARHRLCPGGGGRGHPAGRVRQRELGANQPLPSGGCGELFPGQRGVGEPEKKITKCNLHT